MPTLACSKEEHAELTLAGQSCPRTSPVRAAPPNKLRRYRHFLRRGQIGPTGLPNLNHARLHLACTTVIVITRDLPRATIRGEQGMTY